MSKDAVKQMFGKMEKDAVLKGKYAELMQAHQIEAANALAEKLVEFGKTSGFAFSKVDLNAALGEMINKTVNSVELSDDELDKVAGGVTDILTQSNQLAMIILNANMSNSDSLKKAASDLAAKHQQSISDIFGNLR